MKRYFALYHDGVQIGVLHRTTRAAILDAHERDALVKGIASLEDMVFIYRFKEGYEIRELIENDGLE